jgi:hypothetical protein
VCHSHDECSHLSLHERMVGNRDARPELQKYKKNPWKVLVWKASVNSASHGLCLKGGKGITKTLSERNNTLMKGSINLFSVGNHLWCT